ncbi:MAG: hypothetical protein MUO31_06580 [Thermodesulfovibrionales bacterium]|nr:hypothetical protein [Thermodesulfovibrionales bacterium]
MAKKTLPSPLCVDIREAKPNKLFTEEQRELVRFLVYNKKVHCRRCNRKVKIMWTMLCEFYAMNMGQHSMDKGEKYMPLTPVCSEHPLKPGID